MKRLNLLFPYVLLAVVVLAVVVSNVRMSADTSMPDAARHSEAAADGRLVDVVCSMEVNDSWNITTNHDGEVYYFCTEMCKEAFEENTAKYLAARCLVCKEDLTNSEAVRATYLDESYELCSESCRQEFKRDPAAFFMHTMWGIPTWLYYGSIAVVLIVSFGVFDWLSRRAPESRTPRGEKPLRIQAGDIRGEGERLMGKAPATGVPGSAVIALPLLSDVTARTNARPASARSATDRFDLMGVGLIRAALRSRVFRFALQALFVGAFLLIIAAGLFGNQNPALNIAPILTWTIWWALLIVLIMFAGKAWCYVCPWDAMAGWTEKLAFWRKKDDGLSLGLKWPRIVRNISIATILFVGLTWIELGFGVTMKPRVTAYLAVAMLLMAVVSALLFDRKSFCRYGCLVGRVSGLYALFAGVEVRAKDAGVCKTCKTKECVHGTETAYGCPTFLYPGGLKTNTYCIQCMECVQTCSHDNLASIFARGAATWRPKAGRAPTKPTWRC